MKKWFVLFLITIFSFISWPPPAHAQASTNEEVGEDADNPKEDEGHVKEKLGNKFNVSDDTIKKLRDQKLGYGEIDTTIGLAKQLPGGITDENINKVLSLRQGDGKKKMGWGNVAKELDLKMGDIKGNKKSDTTSSATSQSPTTPSSTKSNHNSKSSENRGWKNSPGAEGRGLSFGPSRSHGRR